MNWQEVCDNPNLKNLPFKIELNEYGKIVMSPQKVYHSACQGRISYLLQTLLKTVGTLAECAIRTRKGPKVADVAWATGERFALIKTESECSVAPEICVEIISESNSMKKMDEKRDLYFEQGALEFWLCDEHGNLLFFNHSGQILQSAIAENFPVRLDL